MLFSRASSLPLRSLARRLQCSIRGPIGKAVGEDLTLTAAEEAELSKTWMSKYWKGFVAANVVFGAVLHGGLQMEIDTRYPSAKEYMNNVAVNAVWSGTFGAILMGIFGVVGIHSRALWIFLNAATFAPFWDRVLAQSVVLPIARAVYNARHAESNKKEEGG